MMVSSFYHHGIIHDYGAFGLCPQKVSLKKHEHYSITLVLSEERFYRDLVVIIIIVRIHAQ